ncbi:NAD(P)-binding protein [Gluconacetobacter tumulisoli]|uniref:NAD(P)/FAD-dependent oxidoreductase n=1 Tax=Gluconacetobacter tumulisoli TaxID=1286189 RepID=A0A7W4K7V1_9PROT|nr:FAD/NAD(P)-binding protein [Gluconacetobacter tumulisoli]MBB2201966.1 NAD(P)/FAD-dependent oxidoreductase [Gluconacetobacter tumulisoli]
MKRSSITRRDFINGVSAVTLSGLLGGSYAASAADSTTARADDPPLKQGLRGQYPGSFEIAHVARDGGFTGPVQARDTGEHYDLVVVGGGISGLSAAWFYRRALGPATRVLVIDNHDDFGGHAKRNEYRIQGRTLLSYGGTMSIESPFPYSFTAKSLLSELGVDLSRTGGIEQPRIFSGMNRGVFFDSDHFTADRILAGYTPNAPASFWKDAPLDEPSRRALIHLHDPRVNFLPGMTPRARRVLLQSISYETFLRNYAKLPDQAVAFFHGDGYRNNMRVDSCPAFMAMRYGAPGFAGMGIEQDPVDDSPVFHFPDGNASIARLLVSQLVSAVFGTPQNMESIVTAQADYGELDRAGSPVRIRLGQMVVRVEHVGGASAQDKAAGKAPVRIVYQKPDGSDPARHAVTAENVVLACFNNIIPYIVPELPDPQKEALKYPSKVPMMYTSVVLGNWRAWKQAGISSLSVPHGYYQHLLLDSPARFGAFETVLSPDEPVTLHMLRNPNFPGHPRKEQNRMGRAEMLATSFETIEKETRAQLQRIFGPHGFNEEQDILGLTVNRWPHGYAYTYDTLGDPEFPEAEQPHVVGRRPFGRIAIANADSGASAFTNIAIDEAERAVQECLVSRGYT